MHFFKLHSRWIKTNALSCYESQFCTPVHKLFYLHTLGGAINFIYFRYSLRKNTLLRMNGPSSKLAQLYIQLKGSQQFIYGSGVINQNVEYVSLQRKNTWQFIMNLKISGLVYEYTIVILFEIQNCVKISGFY